MNSSEKLRLKLILAFFLVAFAAVLAKAVKVQIIDGQKLIAESKNQFFRESKVFPRRGMIFDRNGHPLALNIQTYSIFTIPSSLDSEFSSLKKLSKVVEELDYKQIKKRVSQRTRFTWIARKISLTSEQVQEVETIPGVHIEAVPKRMYPNNELLSQVLGFVGVDNIGLSGVEHRFDKSLKGKPTISRYVIDNRGRPIKFESAQVEGGSENLTLSIDKDIQFVAEKAIKKAVEKFDADIGGIGVMHTQTGEILAMANYPSFDSNFPHLNPNGIQRLPFVTDPFEPGSTFKTFTVASALENNVARADTNYYCERGQLKIGKHIVREAEHNKTYEWLSVNEILKNSSNIGTTKIAFDLTYPRLEETIINFGFGKRTGIEVPGESRGIFNQQKNVSPIRLSNISFGQGLAATGVQMLAAYAAIANGGEYISPTIVKRDESEIEKRRVISERTAIELQEMLVDAVERGTGSNAKVPYFSIAGKTSTAQRSSPQGGYDGYVPGFIGFPVNVNDQFVIYVYIDNPKEDSVYGNQVAAPVFQEVAQHILYNSREFQNIDFVEKIKNKPPSSDTVRMRQAASRHKGQGRVPNFMGLDRLSSSGLAENYDLRIDHIGIGVVNSQYPEPGESIEADTVVKLRYSPPQYE